MRQAHPRNRTGRRIILAGLGLAISATGLLVLGAQATLQPQGAAARLGLAPRVRDSAESVNAPIVASTAVGPHRRSWTTPSNHGVSRPVVDVPDIAPRVVPRAPAGSRVVVLGDSYTTGWAGAGLGSRNWTAIVGRTRSWTMLNLAVAGTGYMNPGWTHQPVEALIAAAVRLRPDVVILASGHNDSRWSAATTSREAERVISRLHASLPDAVLVIVAPIWQNGSPPARALVLRDRLRAATTAADGVFVDPLAGRWFAGASHALIGADGLHPTNDGHRHIADRLLADLAERLSN